MRQHVNIVGMPHQKNRGLEKATSQTLLYYSPAMQAKSKHSGRKLLDSLADQLREFNHEVQIANGPVRGEDPPRCFCISSSSSGGRCAGLARAKSLSVADKLQFFLSISLSSIVRDFLLLRGKGTRRGIHEEIMLVWRYVICLNFSSVVSLVAIKFAGLHELAIASNSLGIPTFAIQHGAGVSFAKGVAGRARKNPAESPARHIFCWNEAYALRYRQNYKKYPGKFHIGQAPWKPENLLRLSFKPKSVLIVESDDSIWDSELVREIQSTYLDWNVTIAAHPYLVEKSISKASQDFRELCTVGVQEGRKPQIAISFGSTVAFGLMAGGTCALNVVRPNPPKFSTAEGEWPAFTTFVAPASQSGLTELLDTLIRSPKARHRQREEQLAWLREHFPGGEDNIARDISRLSKKPHIYAGHH